jgi:hypothetical protein
MWQGLNGPCLFRFKAQEPTPFRAVQSLRSCLEACYIYGVQACSHWQGCLCSCPWHVTLTCLCMQGVPVRACSSVSDLKARHHPILLVVSDRSPVSCVDAHTPVLQWSHPPVSGMVVVTGGCRYYHIHMTCRAVHLCNGLFCTCGSRTCSNVLPSHWGEIQGVDMGTMFATR